MLELTANYEKHEPLEVWVYRDVCERQMHPMVTISDGTGQRQTSGCWYFPMKVRPVHKTIPIEEFAHAFGQQPPPPGTKTKAIITNWNGSMPKGEEQ